MEQAVLGHRRCSPDPEVQVQRLPHPEGLQARERGPLRGAEGLCRGGQHVGTGPSGNSQAGGGAGRGAAGGVPTPSPQDWTTRPLAFRNQRSHWQGLC